MAQLSNLGAVAAEKIRTDEESWQQLETYISAHSEALFSHGMCPTCFDEQMKIIKRK